MEGNIEATKVYTVKEAAQLLGVHPQTIERFCKGGRIKAQKIRGWKILGQALIDFMLNSQPITQTNTSHEFTNDKPKTPLQKVSEEKEAFDE